MNTIGAIQLFQPDPLFFRKQSFKLKSWTDTVVGYINEADKLSRCMALNCRYLGRNYEWAVSINFEKVMGPDSVRAIWRQVCRRLKDAGLIALWIREPSLSNHCNYHLVIANHNYTKTELEQVIARSLPPRSEVPSHKQIATIQSHYHYLRYVTKAKTTGQIGERTISDTYGPKRLLFKAGLNLRKFGTIGPFWSRPKRLLWAEIKQREQRIADGLKTPGMGQLIDHVSDLLQASLTYPQLRRSLGYFATESAIIEWRKNVVGDLSECAV